MTLSKFHSKDKRLLGAASQKLIRHGDLPSFVHPCVKVHFVLLSWRLILVGCFVVFQGGQLFSLRGDPREAPKCSAVQGK